MACIKFIAVSRGLKGIMEYVTDKEKTEARLISGVNCVAKTALDEFEAVKKQFRKTDGRAYYHIVQAFSPDDPLDFDTAHELGIKLAQYFKGYQCLVVTHMNTAHIHNHIIMNSVNFETGRKFHQTARDMEQIKHYSNRLCRQYNLSTTEPKAAKFAPWKRRLTTAIYLGMKVCRTKDAFISYMKGRGYDVKWEDGHKYITYTTPENMRCRDNKLFDEALFRANLEMYFAMGGCDYHQAEQSRQRSCSEPAPTIEDTVMSMGSIWDALIAEDTKRFHLETVHHSDDEIEMMLSRGKKISKAQYTVVDEEEDEEQEYRHYHGFDMVTPW